MALWSHLIPRIHRSDGLDQRYHVLDNYRNKTTFEEHGTRLDPLLDNDFESPPQGYYTRTMSTTTSARVRETPQAVLRTGTTASLTPSIFTSTMRTKTVTSQIVKLTTSALRKTVVASSKPSNNGGSKPAGISSDLYLTMTVLVGSALLLLNIVIFVVMYCQKRSAKKDTGVGGGAVGFSDAHRNQERTAAVDNGNDSRRRVGGEVDGREDSDCLKNSNGRETDSCCSDASCCLTQSNSEAVKGQPRVGGGGGTPGSLNQQHRSFASTRPSPVKAAAVYAARSMPWSTTQGLRGCPTLTTGGEYTSSYTTSSRTALDSSRGAGGNEGGGGVTPKCLSSFASGSTSTSLNGYNNPSTTV